MSNLTEFAVNTTLSNLTDIAAANSTSMADPNVVRTFVAFQIIGGQIGLPLVVLVILLRPEHVTRHVTFLNFCITWIISSTCYLLLTYGGQQLGPNPRYGLCLTQASLLYAAPVMTAASSAALVAQMWLSTRFRPGQTPGRFDAIRGRLFIIVPYAFFILFTIIAAVLGGRHPLDVGRASTGMFCSVKNIPIAPVTQLLAGLFTLLAIGFEVAILMHLFKDWKSFRNNTSGVSMNFLIRLGVFTFVAVLGVIVAIIFLARIKSSFPHLFLSFLPLAAFVIFGTQSDILLAMCFWRKDEDDEAPMVRLPSRSSTKEFEEPKKEVEEAPHITLE